VRLDQVGLPAVNRLDARRLRANFGNPFNRNKLNNWRTPVQKYLVYEVQHQGPATHALVIGVGEYPHLVGGSGPLSPDNDGMGQLSCPPISARRFAEWLVSRHRNPGRPLSTVALLISDAQGSEGDFIDPKTGNHVHTEEATYENVSAAILDWAGRGDQNPGNMLLFYFCGHGISQGSDMSLLMSDFGKPEVQPLEQALDFRRFRLGMSRKVPRQQVYFVDACRSSSETLIESAGYAGRVPVRPGEQDAAEAPTFFATLSGEAAFGKPNQTSVFTDALLKGLQGAGSDISEGDWRVTTTRLKEAIDYHMAQAFKEARRVQIPPTDDLTTFDLHYLEGEPEVPVLITCIPEEENRNAELSYEREGRKHKRPPGREPWSIVLQSGDYLFSAEFPEGARPRIEARTSVHPVYRKVPLKVRS
jgi:hypothetical protein